MVGFHSSPSTTAAALEGDESCDLHSLIAIIVAMNIYMAE